MLVVPLRFGLRGVPEGSYGDGYSLPAPCGTWTISLRRGHMKSALLIVILILGLSSVSQAARLDTSFIFSTIETPNFSIHFHQGLEGVARKAAVIAEDVHGKLTTEFNWRPDEKTELVLVDNSDFANGYATVLPYNIIFIQVVQPTLMSTLGEYDDWLRTLITHEYTHIMILNPLTGYSKVMRGIFGKPLPGGDPLSGLLFIAAAPPKIFMPRWWHEGLAVWSETEYTGAGRGRSSFYDMIFRMAVAGDNLPTIDKINGNAPDWPAGELAYLYGYRLHRYIADTYGKDAIRKLTLAHSGRFPYFIGAPPQELFGGKNYSDLYNDMIAALKREESQRIASLAAAPFTSLQTVSNRGEILTNPRYSPDGNRIAFTRQDPHDHTSTVITDKSGSTVLTRFRSSNSDGNFCWSPDGGTLYFTQPAVYSGFNTYHDLYAFDTARNSITRMTHGQRLSDADLSPDGTSFAVVVSLRGSQNLALIERREPGKVMTPRLVTNYTLQRVSAPRWSHDSTTISYAVTDNDGHTSIHLYDVASGNDRTLFTRNHTVAYPVWSRDDSCLIYVSDETGVFNLFAYDLTKGKSYQVSHLLGGALQPDVSPDGREVIFSSYDSHGFSIARMTLDREKWSETRGPSLPVSGGITGSLPAGTGGKAGTADESAPRVISSPYNSLHTLAPRFWLPRISADGSGKAAFGLFTAGTDVLGYNRYVLTADYGPGRNRGYFNINYKNDYYYPTLTLDAHSKPFLYSDLLQRGDYYELNQGVTLEASFPVNFLESRYRIDAGYQLQDQRALSALNSSGRFNGVTVFQGRQDNIFAGINFDSALRYPYSISPEEGRRVSLMYRYFDRALGSDLNLSKLSADYQEFISLPLLALKHHVLYLRFAGALATGSTNFGQQAFQIGGTPSDLNPYPMRGYPINFMVGKYVATGTLEYRAPLFYPFYGSGTIPAFAEKIHGAFFTDAGEV